MHYFIIKKIILYRSVQYDEIPYIMVCYIIYILACKYTHAVGILLIVAYSCMNEKIGICLMLKNYSMLFKPHKHKQRVCRIKFSFTAYYI